MPPSWDSPQTPPGSTIGPSVTPRLAASVSRSLCSSGSLSACTRVCPCVPCALWVALPLLLCLSFSVLL